MSVGRSVVRSVGRMARRTVGRSIGRTVGRSVGRSVGPAFVFLRFLAYLLPLPNRTRLGCPVYGLVLKKHYGDGRTEFNDSPQKSDRHWNIANFNGMGNFEKIAKSKIPNLPCHQLRVQRV